MHHTTYPKRKASYSRWQGPRNTCKAICMKLINWPPKCIKMLRSFGCFRAMLQNQGISREIVQNRTTRSKLRLLQHVWIFKGLGPSSTSLHYIPVFPVSFLSKFLMTENIYSTHVRLSCYFIEVRTWWKIHWDDMMPYRRGCCRCSEEGACSRQRRIVGWMAKHWQSIPLPWFKQAKFTLSSC